MLQAPTELIFSGPDEGAEPQTTTSEVVAAYAHQAYRQTTIMSIARSNAIESQNKEGPLLQPDEINKKYNINATTPLTERAAIVIQGEQEEVNRLNTIIEQGPKSFWGGTVPGFMGAIAAGMADPADFALGIGVGSAAKGLAVGVKAARTMQTSAAVAESLKWAQLGASSSVALTAKSAFAADAIGNIISNATTEAFNYNATKKEQMQIAADEVFRNVVATSLMFTGIIHGAGSVLNKLSRINSNVVEHLNNTAELAVKADANVATILERPIAALEADKVIDEPFATAFQNTFPEKTDVLLDDTIDIVGIREELKKYPSVTPAKMDEFIAALKDEGFDMRKTYLLDENSKPKLSDETISLMQKDLQDPKNKLSYNAEADQIVNSKEPALEITTTPDTLSKEIAVLSDYDQAFNDFAEKNNGDFTEFRTADIEYKKVELETKSYVRSLRDFATCLLKAAT